MAMSSLSDEPLTDGVTADMTGYMLGYARSLPHGLNCTLQVSLHGNIQGGHECALAVEDGLGLESAEKQGEKEGRLKRRNVRYPFESPSAMAPSGHRDNLILRPGLS